MDEQKQIFSDVQAVIKALREEARNQNGMPHQQATISGCEQFLISKSFVLPAAQRDIVEKWLDGLELNYGN